MGRDALTSFAVFIPGKKKNTVPTRKTIRAVYVYGSIAEIIVSNWLSRFRRGKFNLEGQERPGRPAVIDDD